MIEVTLTPSLFVLTLFQSPGTLLVRTYWRLNSIICCVQVAPTVALGKPPWIICTFASLARNDRSLNYFGMYTFARDTRPSICTQAKLGSSHFDLALALREPQALRNRNRDGFCRLLNAESEYSLRSSRSKGLHMVVVRVSYEA